MLGDAGAVGNAVEVPLRVTERPTNPFEIADGHAGREIPWIVVEAFETLDAGVDCDVRARSQGQVCLAGVTLQRRGTTAATLIDQDDVAIADNARKRPLNRHVEPRCGFAGTARDDHQGIRRRLFGKRPDEGDE